MPKFLRFRSLAVTGTALQSVILAAGVSVAVTGTADAGAFKRTATWPVFENLPEGVDRKTETAAEILAASPDGKTVVYTDSPFESLGFVDISDPSAPKGAGALKLTGEPTSVVVAGNKALVGVNTSKDFTNPSGHVAVIDLTSRQVAARCAIPGQPDSLALSPDGTLLAVAIENERDEDKNDGAIPQLPGGALSLFDMNADGTPKNCAGVRTVSLKDLAQIAGDDPEPEYVYINGQNEVAVTLQENNHLVIVDGKRGEVLKHFSAGTVDLDKIDVEKDKVLDFTGSKKGLRREPDAVAWIDDERFVTANEGDYKGGSRGFTIFNKNGQVEYESGNAFEHLAARLGHYPEKRGGKKGTEPEGVAVGEFGGKKLIFVGAERANLIGVYADQGKGKAPVFHQALPSGVKPEGILPIPSRGLVVVAAEEDDAKEKVRSNIAIYAWGEKGAYPLIQSADKDGVPIGWGAMSGLAADKTDANILYAVGDSYYEKSRIYKIDASQSPAKIVDFISLKKDGKPVSVDQEGIAIAGDGNFWIATEGRPHSEKKGKVEKERKNTILHVAKDGTVVEEIRLPEALQKVKKRFGFEGVAAVGSGNSERIYVAVQREWKDDPEGMTKIAIYDRGSKQWSFVHYPLDKKEHTGKGWVGLSEIVHLGGDAFAIVERDNQGGPTANVKRVYKVSFKDVTPVAYGGVYPVLKKTLMADLLPAMKGTAGWTPDKVEGFAVSKDGTAFAITDNDGVDDATGETIFWKVSLK